MHSKLLSQMVMVLMASSGVLAHMEMLKPFPILSKNDPKNAGKQDIDYSMTRPLASEGGVSDYPCFGYTTKEAHSVETYAAGQTYQLQIGGAAPHNGGSCQLSLSYDNGASFKVIKSMIGDCPVQTEYSFTIPSTAPAGKNILFAWTWFNYSGNREMYMNCARVDITGTSGGQLTGPEIFKANIVGETCITPEGVDINFPNPGLDVVYGKAGLKGTAPTIIQGCQSGSGDGSSGSAPEEEEEKAVDAPVLEKPVNEEAGGDDDVAAPAPSSTSVPPTAQLVVPTPSSVAPVYSAPPATSIAPVYSAPPAASVAPVYSAPASFSAAPVASATPTAPVAPAPSAPAASDPATLVTSKIATPAGTPAPAAPAAPAAPSTPGSCIAGAILCAADGISWSVCNNGVYVSMGTVADGTTCRSETFKFAETDPLGFCDDLADGETKCTKDGQGWAVCVGGTWIDMGLVSAGQSCSDGKIAKRTVRRHRHRRAHGSHP